MGLNMDAVLRVIARERRRTDSAFLEFQVLPAAIDEDLCWFLKHSAKGAAPLHTDAEEY